MGYLGGYLEVHDKTPIKIHVPTVSYVMLTLATAFRSGVLMTFTCFGVVGVEWWFYDCC